MAFRANPSLLPSLLKVGRIAEFGDFPKDFPQSPSFATTSRNSVHFPKIISGRQRIEEGVGLGVCLY